MILDRLKSISTPALIIASLVFVIVVAGGVSQCSREEKEQAGYQAQQTQQSSQAIADAAKNAIQTMENREATEQNIAAAVEQAKGGIEDAQSVEAINQVVTASLCKREAYRADPACLRGQQ